MSVGGAGALNHYIDRDLDLIMDRTKRRPIPSGRIPPTIALIFGMLLIMVSLIITIIMLNQLTAFFIALGVFIYVIVYTLWLKRRTYWNIVIGGVAGVCAPLAGSAAAGSITVTALILGLIVFLWIPGHFWPLALRLLEDYRKAGIPMLPVIKGANYTIRCVMLFIFMLTMLSMMIILIKPSLFYAIVTLSASLYMIFLSIKMLKKNNYNARSLFKFSSVWLIAVMIAILF